MKIITDTGIVEFKPAFKVAVDRQERDSNGEVYFAVRNDNLVSVKQEVVHNVLNGYWWFDASRIEEIRGRLAAKGIGLVIVEEDHEVENH